MIRLIDKILTDLERNLKNTVITFRIYAMVFVFTSVVFGFYGILSLWPVLRSKATLLNEIKYDISILKTNISNLEKAQTDLNTHNDDVKLLDTYMPVETNVQNYMIGLIKSAGDEGFNVKSFSRVTQDALNGRMDLNIVIQSNQFPTNLINEIETLKRVTQVRQITVFKNSLGEIDINLLLTIYNLII